MATRMRRSVTMDAWSPDQLRKMQLGGNDVLNTFLSKYSVDKFTDIKDKYNSQAAEVSRCDLAPHVPFQPGCLLSLCV